MTTFHDDGGYIGTTDFNATEVDALTAGEWLRLIHEADPLAGYVMVKTPDGSFRILDTANVESRVHAD
jgi:hypothetical protein